MHFRAIVLCSGIALISARLWAAATIPVVNLSPSASDSGLLPDVTLNQGSFSTSPPGKVRGIFDRDLFGWANATSPRVFSGSSLQPYLTWSSPQTIRTVRTFDDLSGGYNQVFVDTLHGTGDPTIEANWVQRVDTGAGFSQGTFNSNRLVDLDLGADITTGGVRVRVSKTGSDISVGEVETFADLVGHRTLSASRRAPTGTAASSTHPGTSPSFANQLSDRWLSLGSASNSGSDFWLQYNFAAGTNIHLLGVSFKQETQGGTAITFRIPNQWKVQADLGSGFVDVGTFFSDTNVVGNTSARYYMNLPSLLGVQSLRLVINEADVPDVDGNDQGVGVALMEAFDVPEPSAATLIGLAIFALITRRRDRD